ncbi:MAG: lipocalin-like domain-containing protein [Acetobacteraceae bacterium]|nr:lipocalin-like domain-containing protein [Acetobacteraceae bacterium]
MDLTHAMFISLFPDWTGQTQRRVARLEGDTLHLSTQSPIKPGGKIVSWRLAWRRAERQ